MNEFRELRAIMRHRIPSWTPRNIVRAFPASILLLAVICTLSAYTGKYTPESYLQVLDRFGLAWANIRDGHLWHLMTGEWIQSSPGLERSMVLMLLGSMLPCELLAGSKRFLIVFVTGDWVSSLLSVIAMRIMASFDIGDAARMLPIEDAGSSAGAHVAFAITVTLLPGRLAIPVWLGLFGITVTMFWYQELTAALVHLIAVLLGGGVGWFVLRPRVLAERET